NFFSSMGRARSSGGIMQTSAFQPRSAMEATAISMPALILAASRPGGMAGSEKSTVSGAWPTKRMRVMSLPLGIGPAPRVSAPAILATPWPGRPCFVHRVNPPRALQRQVALGVVAHHEVAQLLVAIRWHRAGA